ncbi:1118_t:CDS:2, partial [Cetraspora pellucida]
TQPVNRFIERLYGITLTRDNIIKETSSQLVFEAATERDLFRPAEMPTWRTLNVGTPKIHDAKPRKSIGFANVIFNKENVDIKDSDNDLMLLDDKLELSAAFLRFAIENVVFQEN